MARIAFACAPYCGHINFTIPVARRLRKEGHTVLYVTKPKKWAVGRLFDEGFPVLAFDPEALYGSPSGIPLSVDDVSDWSALVEIYRRNVQTRPEAAWPYHDRRYHDQLLLKSAEGRLSLPRKVGIVCLLNEGLRDQDLEARLETWIGGDRAAAERCPSGAAQSLARNRWLLESCFFPGAFRLGPVRPSAATGGRRRWLDRLGPRRGALMASAGAGAAAARRNFIPEYMEILAPDIFLFEPAARLSTLLTGDVLKGVRAAELQYSFFCEPGFSHPPLDSSIVADGKPWTHLRIAAQWAVRLLRFRVRRLVTQFVTGTSAERVLTRVHATAEGTRARPVTYSWDGTPELRNSPKIILSPGELEFRGLRPAGDRCRYLNPGLPEDESSGPAVFDGFEGRVVYCTLGTVVPYRYPDDTEFFFRKIIAIFERRPSYGLILSVWDHRLLDRLRSDARNVSIRQSVVQMSVLRSSVLAIHHAGHNTILDCILQGVPMLLYPHSTTDQRGNAARASQHDLALRIRAKEPLAALENKIDALLGDPRYRSSVMRMRDRIRQSTPANLFEDLEGAIRSIGTQRA